MLGRIIIVLEREFQIIDHLSVIQEIVNHEIASRSFKFGIHGMIMKMVIVLRKLHGNEI